MNRLNQADRKPYKQIKQQTRQQENSGCPFCTKRNLVIDYKNIATLKQFTSSFEKILPKRKTKVCGKHQRKLDTAVKRARIMGLLPFVKE